MSKKTETNPDFEKTLVELEKLVVNLEEGDLSLDESLTSFKRGIELTRQCQSVSIGQCSANSRTAGRY